MLEAQSGDRVGQFDVDAKVVRVQLELISAEQRRGWIDVHGQRRDRAVERQLPVAVAGWVGLKIDHVRCSGRLVRTNAAIAARVVCFASRCGAWRAPWISLVSSGERISRSST